ncbi:DUF547 domain-containing protein [uncultured Flavobacterium sp.]|uniref:DUF547 domain-containing protein n=1 Tax=uncultured Flavobacterium sp. TaxID=165435 RepID=UPI0030EBF82F|tara:strand:- start:820 stop:1263 length:444 start_codon:yes stop_codon:yes gene_type:complete
MENYLITLSENILFQAQNKQDTTYLRRELQYLELSMLEGFLDSDELKNTFWTNIYNAFFLIIAGGAMQMKAAYKYKRIMICENILSLDDIEYKILKRNNNRFSQKLRTVLFSSSFIKGLALANVGLSRQLILNRSTRCTSHNNKEVS